jgi:predicted membrane-bound mannosyltransferase
MVRRFYAVGWSLPFVVGAALRLWNLRGQILGGDETHAIRAALNFTLPKILVTYQVTDNCIPLTALYKLFLLAGMPLTETLLRLPVLLCGLAALLALPAAFAGRLDRGTVLVYRWLLAISPALVLYSRIARSYMPMVLLSFGAVMAFEA